MFKYMDRMVWVKEERKKLSPVVKVILGVISSVKEKYVRGCKR
jgi:hypothetical protein